MGVGTRMEGPRYLRRRREVGKGKVADEVEVRVENLAVERYASYLGCRTYHCDHLLKMHLFTSFRMSTTQ